MTDHKTGTHDEWRAARLELLEAEKAHTRTGDELARRRQELPWVRIDKEYRFETDEGPASLADLFRGRSQLLVYHFMFGPDYKAGCPACSAIADGFDGFVVHLANHDVTLSAVSRAPLAKLQAYKQRMGWDLEWASGNDFNHDLGVGPETPRAGEYQDGEDFGLSVFLRDGDAVYRTYFTNRRGVETIGPVWTFLDLTPLGRQEDWEDSPEGRPKTKRYDWWRRHDEYGR